jgi:hypothetical protein
MSRLVISLLRRIDPETRLEWAARIFVASIILGALSVIFLAEGYYQKVLMFISWGAITVTCIDVILTADVRKENDEGR